MSKIKISPFYILVFGALSIAFSPIFVRFSDVDPIMTAFYRIFISLPFFYIFSSFNIIKKIKFPQFSKSYVIFVLSGIFFALDLICWHWSIKLTTVSKATFLSNLAPVIVILFSLFFLNEKFSRLFYIAVFLSMTGTFILLGESFQFNKSQFMGDLLGVLTAVWYGSYILTISQLRRIYNSSTIMLISGIITAIILFVVSILFEQSLVPQSLYTISIIFLLGFVCQFMGQSFITYSLAYLSASLSSLCLLIQPIAATVLAYFFFQEKLTIIQFLGSALILIGIYIARTKNVK